MSTKMRYFVALVAVTLACCEVAANLDEAEKDLMNIMNMIMKPRKPERFWQDAAYKGTKINANNNPTLTHFSYNDCGSAADSARIHSVQLTPDPLVFPGQIGITFNATNTKPAEAPIQASVTMKKKIVFWIEVPCVDNIGSCTYSDICKMLPQSQCPHSFVTHKIPCKCPVPQGQFNLPLSKFNVNVHGIPGGDYSAQVQLKSRAGPLACLQINFSIA